jgi:hypothetical protein
MTPEIKVSRKNSKGLHTAKLLLNIKHTSNNIPYHCKHKTYKAFQDVHECILSLAMKEALTEAG